MKINLLVVVVCVSVIIVMVVTSLRPPGRTGVSILKDTARMRAMHDQMLVYAGDNKGMLPRPGLINRRADVFTGQDLPGSGPENTRKNTTRHLYSALVTLNYVNEEMLIAARESNPRIRACDAYDFEAYQPAADVYWDGDDANNGAGGPGRFMTTLDGSNDEPCHASFAHLAIFGVRAKTDWRADAPATALLLSNRMPWQRAASGAEYDRSYTLKLHEPDDRWIGAAVFGDNHTETLTGIPPGPDVVGMTKSVEDGVVTQYHEELTGK